MLLLLIVDANDHVAGPAFCLLFHRGSTSEPSQVRKIAGSKVAVVKAVSGTYAYAVMSSNCMYVTVSRWPTWRAGTVE